MKSNLNSWSKSTKLVSLKSVITHFNPKDFPGYLARKPRQLDQCKNRPKVLEIPKSINPRSPFKGWVLASLTGFDQVWPEPWLSSVRNWLINFPSFGGAQEDLQIDSLRAQNRLETRKLWPKLRKTARHLVKFY